MLWGMKDSSEVGPARAVFATNLRRARRLQEVSQEQLALRSGMSRVFVGQIERGERSLTIDSMGALAEALGVPLRDLVDPEYLSSAKTKSK
jgi:transcriptional regulator with XRE-family HTH domain